MLIICWAEVVPDIYLYVRLYRYMALRRGIGSKRFVTWFLKFSDANKHALGWSDHAGIVQNHRLCNDLKGYETNSNLPYKINKMIKT